MQVSLENKFPTYTVVLHFVQMRDRESTSYKGMGIEQLEKLLTERVKHQTITGSVVKSALAMATQSKQEDPNGNWESLKFIADELNIKYNVAQALVHCTKSRLADAKIKDGMEPVWVPIKDEMLAGINKAYDALLAENN